MEEIKTETEPKCSFCGAVEEAKRLLEEQDKNSNGNSIEFSKDTGQYKDPLVYCMKAWRFLQLFLERQSIYYSRKQEFAKSFADLPIGKDTNTVMYSYDFYFKGDNISSVIAKPLDPRLKFLEATIYRSFRKGGNTLTIRSLIQVGEKEYRRESDEVQPGELSLYPGWKNHCF